MQKKLLNYCELPLEKPDGNIKKKVVLVTDSKGRYLKAVSEPQSEDIIWIIHPGSKCIHNKKWLNKNIHRLRETYGPLHVYFWLGTCDLTNKVGKKIKLVDNIDATVQELTQEYTEVIDLCKKEQCTATILEMPYYSISIWNKTKSPTESDLDDTVQDKQLLDHIDQLNQNIKDINSTNGVRSPVFNADICKSRKSKGKCTRYSIDMKLFKDGIHPDLLLSRAWIKSITKTIYRDCY